jgi:hypothetical protein
MTKMKLGLAAGVAAILAFGVAACGQTAPSGEEATPPAADSSTTDATPPADAVDAAGEASSTDAAPPAEAPAEAPADSH